jgi:ABC-2 type transport system ATP-binding protein
MTHSIEAINVSKRFGDEQVLKGVNLATNPGEILGVLGPSGAGKTTLIRCLIGTLKLSGGSVSINGTAIPDLALMDSIGYMAQQDALYEDLSGLKNLVFFVRLKGMPGRQALAQAHSLMDMVGLGRDKAKSVVHYSGGMKRRLSLAAALIGDPAVIVLDEPTVGIDPVLRELFWQEFYRLKSLGRTIIITTHVMDEAEKCDRLILLRDGCIIEDATPGQLKAMTPEHTVEAAFIASAKRAMEGGSRQ